jgi:type VI secretion system secreted protein Hcp
MATDMFLKLQGINGESKDDKHKGEIDINSFTFAMAQVGNFGSGGGGGAGKISFENIQFEKNADLSTPALMQHCASGKHIASAILTVRKAGGEQEEYYKMKFTDLLVASVRNTGIGNEVPTETLSLNFAKIEFDYKEQTAKGTLGGKAQFGWDLNKNVKV